MCNSCYLGMRVQLEQNALIDRLPGNTEKFGKTAKPSVLPKELLKQPNPVEITFMNGTEE